MDDDGLLFGTDADGGDALPDLVDADADADADAGGDALPDLPE